jgi:hypothetical protein
MDTLTRPAKVPTSRERFRWLERSVAYFRGLGFFAGHQSLDDAALARLLARSYRREWRRPLGPDLPLADLMVTSLDRSRVYWGDLLGTVAPYRDAYVEFLESLAAISRGAFEPCAIEEIWSEGPIPLEVRFEHRDTPVVLQPLALDGSLDLEVLHPINGCLDGSGMQFHLHEGFETVFVLALTDQEKQRLETERGWRFAAP